jgi:hypothetical protein
MRSTSGTRTQWGRSPQTQAWGSVAPVLHRCLIESPPAMSSAGVLSCCFRGRWCMRWLIRPFLSVAFALAAACGSSQQSGSTGSGGSTAGAGASSGASVSSAGASAGAGSGTTSGSGAPTGGSSGGSTTGGVPGSSFDDAIPIEVTPGQAVATGTLAPPDASAVYYTFSGTQGESLWINARATPTAVPFTPGTWIPWSRSMTDSKL